jgi:type IV secretory pathway protease TraF
VPLLKRVAAVGGDVICAAGPRIFRNGALLAIRRATDARGRALPTWEGCLRLRAGEVFLINHDPASFDGRYFGVSAPHDVIGKAHKL